MKTAQLAQIRRAVPYNPTTEMGLAPWWLARHFSMYLTSKHTNMSSSEVGRYMGGKNHATVLVACKKIEELLQRDAEIHWEGPNGNKLAKARVVVAQLETSITR